MEREEVLADCLGKPGRRKPPLSASRIATRAWEDQPWEGDVVAKVGARRSRPTAGSRTSRRGPTGPGRAYPALRTTEPRRQGR